MENRSTHTQTFLQQASPSQRARNEKKRRQAGPGAASPLPRAGSSRPVGPAGTRPESAGHAYRLPFFLPLPPRCFKAAEAGRGVGAGEDSGSFAGGSGTDLSRACDSASSASSPGAGAVGGAGFEATVGAGRAAGEAAEAGGAANGSDGVDGLAEAAAAAA